MSEVFNVYCDESCHLEGDQHRVMVLGAVWCLLDRVPEVITRLRELKLKHGLAKTFELKWTKVSPGKLDYYRDVLDYFFDDDDLHLRCLIADKTGLHRRDSDDSHDDWYFRMYFDLLKVVLSPESRYRIFLDLKDTRSAAKVAKLHRTLSDNLYDFSRSIVERVQTARSHEVELLQLTDLLTGILSGANRSDIDSAAKLGLIARMKERSGYSLSRTTLVREPKVNLFHWTP
jgi:hypothetical protein